MIAQWEGDGSPPSWDELTAERESPLAADATDHDREWHDAYTAYWHDMWNRAEALLSLDTDQSMALAKLMLDQAERQRKDTEMDLWRKVERAAGYEPGSLTGKPGVTPRVFL